MDAKQSKHPRASSPLLTFWRGERGVRMICLAIVYGGGGGGVSENVSPRYDLAAGSCWLLLLLILPSALDLRLLLLRFAPDVAVGYCCCSLDTAAVGAVAHCCCRRARLGHEA